MTALAGVVAVAAVAWVAYLIGTGAGGTGRVKPPRVADAGLPPAPVAEPEPEPTPVAGPLAPVPDPLADVIYLPPDPVSDGAADGDDFVKELARQALWLAAREEFGLRVRDAHLGDPAPEGLPADRHLRFRGPPRSGPADRWSVSVGPAAGPTTVWEGRTADLAAVSRFAPAEAVAAAERLSRDLWGKCLAAARFAPKPAARSDAPVPAAVEGLLGEMRESAQFAAVRALHAEARAKGESPALLDALARGYANLGLLTEFHWGPAPAVYKARGVLYAQRLLARAPESAAAARTRAYAAAFAGRHDLALADLAAAAKLAAGPAAPAPPAWAEAVDAYVRFDTRRLAAARANVDAPLTRLLEFLTVEDTSEAPPTLKAGRLLLAADPECYRVHDALCRVDGVSNLHAATPAGPAAFAGAFERRVREQPGLPPAVERVLGPGAAAEGRAYAALRAAADPATDRGEPSWAALAGSLQDARFALAWHRLHFLADKLSVDAGAAFAEVADALDGHRLVKLAEACATDRRRDPAGYRQALLAAPVADLDLRAAGYYYTLRTVDPAAAMAWYIKANQRNHLTYPGLARFIWASRGRGPDLKAGLQVHLEQARLLSPRSPFAAEVHAARRDPDAEAGLAELEKEYPDSTAVQRALGARHLADRRFADAARCFRRRLALSPGWAAYRALAAAYEGQGDETLWRETLEASLAAEDAGLEHAEARVALARHFMAKKDFARAAPYARDAAGSGAAWAMLCAAQCEEGLRDWDAADALYRATAARYDGEALSWYFACRYSGRMDRAAAEAACRGYLAALRGGVPREHAYAAARFHQMTGRPAEALPLLARVNADAPSVVGGLSAALTADFLGDAAARKAGVEVAAGVKNADPGFARLAEAVRGWLAAAGPPDAAAVEAGLKGLPPGPAADAELFAGWLLANRGQPARAAAHWRRCADAEAGTRALKTHAKVFLEERAGAKE